MDVPTQRLNRSVVLASGEEGCKTSQMSGPASGKVGAARGGCSEVGVGLFSKVTGDKT